MRGPKPYLIAAIAACLGVAGAFASDRSTAVTRAVVARPAPVTVAADPVVCDRPEMQDACEMQAALAEAGIRMSVAEADIFRRWVEARLFVAWVRGIAIAAWEAALADGPPIGCPTNECYRGGIRARRPCAIPDYICGRESGWWIDIGNPGSSAAGKYQFLIGTWEWAAGSAGYPEWAAGSAGLAPEYVQDAAAGWLWDGGNGAGHWSETL